MPYRSVLSAVLTVAASILVAAQEPPRQIEYVKALAIGGRVDWSHASNLIAFDKAATDGYSEVWVMRPNGTNKLCLTCNKPVSEGHAGNPAWDPTAQYIVFQAQDSALPIVPSDREPFAQFITAPGWGTNNNLWLMTHDGSRFWQLTTAAAGTAILHPQFSRSGARLAWAERVGVAGPAEQWIMQVADLVWEGDSPRLANITAFSPLGTEFFYETHEFLPGDAGLLFSAGDPTTGSLDIYTYDFASGEIRNLTNTPAEWDEHAHFTPDGTKLIWASSRHITIPRDYFVPYTDYWIANADGTGQSRLTYFNEPSTTGYYPGGVVAADFSFGPDGVWFASKLEVPVADYGGIVEIVAAIR